MRAITLLSSNLLLLTLTTSRPISPQSPSEYTNSQLNSTPLLGRTISITPTQILQIDPRTSTCSGALFPTECRTATQAAPLLSTILTKYSITHPSVQAALLSLILYETGGFKYSKSHFPAPGVPGQGTRNMQAFRFNALYAQDLGVSLGSIGGAGDPAAILEGIQALGDEVDFGSVAWYVTTQCGLSVREGMWGGSEAGWSEYLTGCVGTSITEDRKELWESAVKVLGSA